MSNTGLERESEAGIWFDLFDVEPATELLRTYSTRESVSTLIRGDVESCAGFAETDCCVDIVTNPLATAVVLAFSQHRPLRLTPDVIWTAILQGLSMHLEENWAMLRSNVTLSTLEQRIVEVSTESFPFGSPEAPWEELVIDATTMAYGAVREEVADLFSVSFSTTTSRDRAAMDLAFLAATRSHFVLYDLASICGIPSITITGNREDWLKMREMVENLDHLDLSWWTRLLRPILDEFVVAMEGKVNRKFWKEIYSISNAICGAQERITGWIGHLFPYLPTIGYRVARNRFFEGGEPPNLDSFPIGIREVTMQSSDATNVRLMGGFLGISQASDGTLTPKTGWAVRRESSFDVLLANCASHTKIMASHRSEKTRSEIPIQNKQLKNFYNRFSSMRFMVDNHSACEFLDVSEHRLIKEAPPVYLIANLANNRWLGAIDLVTKEAMRAFMLFKTHIKTAFIVGNDSTLEPEGVAEIITTDFELLLQRILDCVDSSREMSFDSVATLNAQDKEAIAKALDAKNFSQ